MTFRLGLLIPSNRGAWLSVEAVNTSTGLDGVRLRLLIQSKRGVWRSFEAVNTSTGLHGIRLRLSVCQDCLMLTEAVITPKQQCMAFG